MKKILSILLSLTIFVAFVGCDKGDGSSVSKDNSATSSSDSSSKDESKTDEKTGQIIDRTFTSEKYKYSLTVPEKWEIYDKDNANQKVMAALGLQGDAADSQIELFKNAGVEYELFAMDSSSPSPSGGYNNIIIQTTDIKKIGNLSVKDFLDLTMTQAVETYKTSGLKLSEKIDAKPMKVGAHNGNYGVLRYTFDGGEMSQQFFVFIVEDTYIFFTGTSSTAEFFDKMLDILKTIS